MKVIKRVIEYLIAISVIPAIVLTVISVTELKDVRNVQYELLSEEEGIYNITPGTYEKLVANKRIKNYELESNYPLITREEMERGTWIINDDLKNEIYIDEFGQKRIKMNVGRITFDGSEKWVLVNEYDNTIRFRLNQYIVNKQRLNPNNAVSDYIPITEWVTGDFERIMEGDNNDIYLYIDKSRLNGRSIQQYLSQNPITITYELAVKNPKTKVIESSDLDIASDYVRMAKPIDFSGNSAGLLVSDLVQNIDRFDVTTSWIYVYPKNITVAELGSQLVGKTLVYELAQPRPVEVYDFSKFRLVYDKNRIRVVFDIDDEYYLWEITKDDKMIPINGQYDIGGVWTVKFYVYEIQQPLIRSLVLLIPLIVVSGLLVYMMKKKDLSF